MMVALTRDAVAQLVSLLVSQSISSCTGHAQGEERPLKQKQLLSAALMQNHKGDKEVSSAGLMQRCNQRAVAEAKKKLLVSFLLP